MTPALAFFYGGLVAQKNIINTLLLSYVCVSIVLLQWILFGYSLSFEPGTEGQHAPCLLIRHNHQHTLCLYVLIRHNHQHTPCLYIDTITVFLVLPRHV